MMRNLETLDAIEDIRELEARYADETRWEDLAGLFTEDGWFRPFDPDGNELAHMVGRADIATRWVHGTRAMCSPSNSCSPTRSRLSRPPPPRPYGRWPTSSSA